MQNEPKLPCFQPKNDYFAEKQTQTKPNGFDAKMNLNPLLTNYYEKLRLFRQNENKPKTKPKQTQKITFSRGSVDINIPFLSN